MLVSFGWMMTGKSQLDSGCVERLNAAWCCLVRCSLVCVESIYVVPQCGITVDSASQAWVKLCIDSVRVSCSTPPLNGAAESCLNKTQQLHKWKGNSFSHQALFINLHGMLLTGIFSAQPWIHLIQCWTLKTSEINVGFIFLRASIVFTV